MLTAWKYLTAASSNADPSEKVVEDEDELSTSGADIDEVLQDVGPIAVDDEGPTNAGDNAEEEGFLEDVPGSEYKTSVNTLGEPNELVGESEDRSMDEASGEGPAPQRDVPDDNNGYTNSKELPEPQPNAKANQANTGGGGSSMFWFFKRATAPTTSSGTFTNRNGESPRVDKATSSDERSSNDQREEPANDGWDFPPDDASSVGERALQPEEQSGDRSLSVSVNATANQSGHQSENLTINVQPSASVMAIEMSSAANNISEIINEEGDLVVTSQAIPDDFLIDDTANMADILSLYEVIAGKLDESLLEAFGSTEETKQGKGVAAAAAEHKKARTAGTTQARDQASTSTFNNNRANESQALFDIMEREFSSLTLTGNIVAAGTQQNQHVDARLTARDVQLCFVGFASCFQPRPISNFATEYNYNSDRAVVKRAEKELASSARKNGALPARRRGLFARLLPKAPKSSGGMDDLARGSNHEREEDILEEEDYMINPTTRERPFVPLHIANTLWAEILVTVLNTRCGTNFSASDIPTSTLLIVRDCLVQLGVIHIRDVPHDISPVKLAAAGCSDDDGTIVTMGTELDRSIYSTTRLLTQVVSIHQDIHQEYGDYLAITRQPEGFLELVEKYEQQWNRAVTRECSLDPIVVSDRAYAVMMLPRNQIKSRRFNDVMELLTDKKFVHQRIQTFGVLEGTTMHVTDVEDLLVQFYEDFTKGLLKDVDPRAFVISTYDQVDQVIRGMLKDAEEVNRTTTEGIEVIPEISSTYLRRTQCEAGKALHLMGVSLGAQGHFREELQFLNAAVALKKAALGSDACVSVSLSDTLHCIGYALDNVGKSRDALDSYSEALIVRRQLLDENDLRLAETLHNKGALLCENGDSENAIHCLEEALLIRRHNLGERHESCADTQQWIGNVMREWGHYDEALVCFESALQIKKETLGADHEDVANTLQNMGIVLDDLADYRNSLECYNEALRIRLLNFGDLDPQVADTYQYIAKVLAITGVPKTALENFNKAICIHEEILRWSPEPVDDIPGFLQSLVRLSRVDEDLFKSRYGRVMECYEEALPITELLKGPTDESLGHILHRMGDLYLRLQDWDNAISSFQGALKVQKALADQGDLRDTEICSLLEKKGVAHLFRNEHQRAKSCFESVVYRLVKLKADSSMMAQSTYCLGVAIHHLKVHKLALLSFQKALCLWTDELGENHLNCGLALHWMGRQELELNNNDRAVMLFRAALQNLKQNQNFGVHTVIIKTLELLGETYENLGDEDSALHCYCEAIRLCRWKMGDFYEYMVPILCRGGDICNRQEDYEKAVEFYDDAIQVMKEGGGENVNERLCVTTEKLGEVYEKVGDFDSAKDGLSEAYRLFESVFGQENLETAGAVFKLGRVLDKQGSHEAAMQCYRECLRVRKAKLGCDHEDVATTLSSMGANLMDRQKFDDAVDYFQEALNAKKRIFGDSSDDVGTTFHSLGVAYYMAGSLDKSVLCFKEALRIKKEIHGDSTEDVAQINFDMATAHDLNKSYKGAISCYGEVLRVWRTTGDDRLPIALNNLGIALDQSGDCAEAATCFSEALHWMKEHCSEDKTFIAELLGKLAKSQSHLGKFDIAIEHQEEKIKLLKTMPEEDEEIADSLYSLGVIHARRDDRRKAVDCFKECLTLRKHLYGGNDERVARVLNKMSAVHEKGDNFRLMKQCLIEALATYRRNGNQGEVSTCLHALGRALGKLGETRAAIECFEEAGKIRKEMFGPQDPLAASSLHCCAGEFVKLNELDKALELFKDVLALRQAQLGPPSLESADTLFMIGKALAAKGKHVGAIKSYTKAMEIQHDCSAQETVEIAITRYFLGISQSIEGDHDASILNLQKALSSQIQLIGEEALEVAATHHALGVAYTRIGKRDAALEVLVKALRTRKLRLGNDAFESAETLSLLGETQLASKRNSEALHCFSEALRVFSTVRGKEDVLVADISEKMGNAYVQISDYARAMESLKRALKIYRDRFDASSPEVARVLLAMGKAESRKGNWNTSIDFYRQSLQISKQKGDNAAMAKALFEVGVALEARGDKGAMTCFTEILRFIDPDKDWAIAAEAHNRIGHILMERGEEVEKGLAEFEHAHSLLKRHAGDETIEMAQTIHNIAGAYEALGKYEESQKHFSEALRIFKERLGPNDLSVALALNNLGINCARRKDYIEALRLCNEALKIRREHLGPEHIDTCDTLFNIATMLDECGNSREAMKIFTEVVTVYRHTTGSDSIEVAHCFQSIGVLHIKLLDEDLAIRALVEALRIYRLAEAESLSIASVLFHLGKIYVAKEEYEKALESLTQSLKTRDKELDDDSTDIADTCDLLGLIYAKKKSNSSALNFYRRAYKIYDKVFGCKSIQSVTVLTKIAGALLDDGNHDQALATFQECLAIVKIEKGEESDEVANILTNIGVIFNKQVDYEEALKFLTVALKIRAKLFGRDHITVGRTLYEIGSVLQEWGDSDEAGESFQEVLRVAQLPDNRNFELMVKALSKLGEISFEKNDYRAAVKSFQEALDVGRKLRFESDDVVNSLLKMAGAYDALSNYDAALNAYSDALRILKLRYGDEQPTVASTLNNIGINHARRKNYAKALEFCSEALRIRKVILGAEHLDVADSCINIASILEEWEKYEQALKFFMEAKYLFAKNLTDDDVEVGNCLQHIGEVQMKLDETDAATESFVEAIRIFRQKKGDESVEVGAALFHLGRVYGKRAEYKKALTCFNESYRLRCAALGSSHFDVVTTNRYIEAIHRKIGSINKKISGM